MSFERLQRPSPSFQHDEDWDNEQDIEHAEPAVSIDPPRTVDEYLQSIRSKGDIEMKEDSKGLAQETVMEWKSSNPTKPTLLVSDKALLIREMMFGAPSDKDSFYVTVLIDDSTDTEIQIMINQFLVDSEKLILTLTPNSASANRVQDIVDPGAKENVLGNRVASNFTNTPEAEQNCGGYCYDAAKGRFNRAYKDIMGVDTKDITGDDFNPVKSTYYRLWSSQGKDNPADVAGGGGPGAIVNQGWGEFVDHKGIWEDGKLRPGAVIQTWPSEEDYKKVKTGSAMFGHSFIFLEYVRENNDPQGKITHVKTANQWGQDLFTDTSFGNYWIGANITASPPKENLPNAKTSASVAEILSGNNKIDESAAVDKNIANGKVNDLDAVKITAAIRAKTTEIKDEKIKNAMLGLNPDRFNIYFAQLVALYQLANGEKPTGIFDNATCMRLTGKNLAEATDLKK
ncbi:MAG: hypothetical protein FD123_1445 [Bacteroidetes bacterium]|nr:MAG: hypothetical protein FD123_1445 [Bacteroidota bacterium]